MVFILTLLSIYNAAFLLHLYPQQAFGLKEGAPIKSCFHMMPKHPKTDSINDIWEAQTGPSPYAINIQFPTLAKDQKQLIFLTGVAPTKLFRGFLAEVREASDNATQPVGYFSSCPENTQPVKCANLIGAQDNVFAVTHTYGFQSNAVELEWVPPSSGGSFKV
ncbi:unnamed protein product [Orchesella dallaii]|uniref:Reelin domain-containing protein n=1 Tax=Orchesella dallaii TaxID=48710 RepID=A0ABP1RR53_9HEXA